MPASVSSTLTQSLSRVPWATLTHAYGPAEDVPALLLAVRVGTDAIRDLAWWELWGNVHHQGTVYEATVSSVPFIAAIAADEAHPDRVEALSFLREIAIGDGTHAPAVHQAVRPRAHALVEAWEHEPELLRRALLWLSSAFPELTEEHPGLTAHLPEALQPAWNELLVERRLHDAGDDDALESMYNDDDVMDRRSELEQWALAGWPPEAPLDR